MTTTLNTTDLERRIYVTLDVLADEATARWSAVSERVIVTIGDARIRITPDQARDLATQLETAADEADEQTGDRP